ncbi:hypothetical protein [Nocardia sp. SC052]|uniref:hypothetical protein n=1 Tax=Nocardia sichangensis TaxID=3385975 RepID=UPI00399F50F4
MELATEFLGQVGAAADAIVVVAQKGTLGYSGVLERYADNRTVLSPQNEHEVRIGYGHPALVYAPGLKQLELATRYVQDRPIAVVEDPSFRCVRWAEEIGAFDLVELKIHSSARSAEHQRILERIDRLGSDGWRDAPGKRELRLCLHDLLRLGVLDKDEIIAYRLVHGKRALYESLTHLGDEIDRVQNR